MLHTIQPALDKINEAWKNASEEMYKAQAEGRCTTSTTCKQNRSEGDNVQDVDFEEVK